MLEHFSQKRINGFHTKGFFDKNHPLIIIGKIYENLKCIYFLFYNITSVLCVFFILYSNIKTIYFVYNIFF